MFINKEREWVEIVLFLLLCLFPRKYGAKFPGVEPSHPPDPLHNNRKDVIQKNAIMFGRLRSTE